MASGYPRRRARSWSSSAKPASAAGATQSSASGATSWRLARASSTTDGDQRQGEGAGLDPGDVERHEPESGSGHRPMDVLPEPCRDRAHEVLDGQLDPSDVPVVADATLAQAERAQGRLRGFDLAQLLGRDLLEVRDAGGQAGRGGLIGAGKTQGMSYGADRVVRVLA